MKFKFSNFMKIKRRKIVYLNNSISISRVVYCCMRIHRNDLRLFNNPIPPVPPPCKNLNATYINIKSHLL